MMMLRMRMKMKMKIPIELVGATEVAQSANTSITNPGPLLLHFLVTHCGHAIRFEIEAHTAKVNWIPRCYCLYPQSSLVIKCLC